jgi:hypothetical protein
MYEGMGDMDGFSLEDLAAEEDQAQAQGQPAASTPAPAAQQTPAPEPQVQVPLYTQQWAQWDAQRRAGNIQPLPVAPPVPPPAGFPWSKILVGAGIAAAVVYGIHLMRKRGKGKSSNPKTLSGSWHTIGEDE